MRLQARQSILDMWQAAVEYSYTKENTWNWGGRRSANCVSDAEQLLVLLYPATTISSLALEKIDDSRADVVRVLRRLGTGQNIPRTILRGALEYFQHYLNEADQPMFSGGSYFEAAESETHTVLRQRELDTVDGYSMSLTLCLAVLGFARVYRTTVTRDDLLTEIAEVEALASHRLSAAMVGLLRSFAVHTFTPDSTDGQNMLFMTNQARVFEDTAASLLAQDLDEDWRALQLSLAEGATESQRHQFREYRDFKDAGHLYECGWSWGVVAGTPPVDWSREAVPFQPDGVAEERPNIYFTVSAMDGIRDLFSERTRSLGLLSVEQTRLAQALQNRLTSTQKFWTKVATFGQGKPWPIEDLPWRTTDGSESDYYTLLLSAVIIQGFNDEKDPSGAIRIARLLEELGMRAKITRRAVVGDPATRLHLPGMRMPMLGSEKVGDGEEPIGWILSSFSVLLLKQVVQVAAQIDNATERSDLLELADRIWEHLQARRLSVQPGRDLWDDAGNLFGEGGASRPGGPSWYHTERAMEALVQVTETVVTESATSSAFRVVVSATLAEAENLFDRELLRASFGARPGSPGERDTVPAALRDALRGVEAALKRSRALQTAQPATSMALAQFALRELDSLTASRQRQ